MGQSLFKPNYPHYHSQARLSSRFNVGHPFSMEYAEDRVIAKA
jgi:hypothetical protein